MMWGAGAKQSWGALAVALWLLAGGVHAQTTVRAELDQETITLDDTVALTVTVAGKSLTRLQEPELPPLDGLRLLNTSTQQSFSLINGQMQSSYSFVYHLQPTRKGTLTIPGLSVTVKGRIYRTSSLELQVTAGTGQASAPPGGTMSRPLLPSDPFGQQSMVEPVDKDAVLARHKVDRKTAYVGQQITYEFTFYQGTSLVGDVDYREADTPGFLVEPLPNPAPTDETLNNRVYRTQKRTKALFATAPGKHTIGSAVVTVGLDPFTAPEELVTEPLAINIIPLPESGKPANFSGAVGKFRVTLNADKTTVRAGETINVQVQVTGVGNIKSLGAPTISLPASARLYEAGESRKAEAGAGGGDPNLIGGTATFSYLVLPREAGNLKLGPVQFSYFDPNTRLYRMAVSNVVTIQVAPGVAGAADTPLPGDDLKPIRTTLGPPLRTPLPYHWWFWVIIGLPLLVLAWAGWHRWQEVRIAADPRQARAGRALRLARERLAEASRVAAHGDCDAGYALLHESVCDYVADRLDAPPAGLTADTVCELLLAAACSADRAEQVRSLLEHAAGGRFAPGGSDPQRAVELVSIADDLLLALQKEVRPPHEAE